MEGRADGENGMAVRADLCLVTGSPWTLGLSDGTMAGSAPRSLDRERPPGQAPRVFVLKSKPRGTHHPVGDHHLRRAEFLTAISRQHLLCLATQEPGPTTATGSRADWLHHRPGPTWVCECVCVCVHCSQSSEP